MNDPEERHAATDRFESPAVGGRLIGSCFASLFLGTPFLSMFAAPGGPAWTLALLALAATLFVLSNRWQPPGGTRITKTQRHKAPNSRGGHKLA